MGNFSAQDKVFVFQVDCESGFELTYRDSGNAIHF